ncbi:hypothetical protein QY049_28875 [Bradyrhizobium sp. WYCCWR 13022]|uniref:hypothetical protein n=1 Tax=unclassified Bradyrhizobium TaxID=2631580 RepID=UPI00263A4EA3|nr:hypothetical protein [Bradyrhizobium sp. WYCCWR 13022]MDN4987180.1 hypothetical protein [Bradyrhizobium sp. WYCCWR 13022]
MTDDADARLEERFHQEMTEGYLDGLKPDNPEPSTNRSHSYRHGFANGRDDLAHSPRLPAQVLRLLADQAIRDDVLIVKGIVRTSSARQDHSSRKRPSRHGGPAKAKDSS